MGKNSKSLKVKNFCSKADTFFSWISTGEKYLAMLCLFSIVVLILYQVVARGVFGTPLPWSEEISTYLFIWCVFLAASVVYYNAGHIIIRTFVGKLSLKTQQVIHIVTNSIVAYIFYTIIHTLFTRTIPTELKGTTVSLPIDLPEAWFFSFPFLFFSINVFIYTIYQVIKKILEMTIDLEDV